MFDLLSNLLNFDLAKLNMGNFALDFVRLLNDHFKISLTDLAIETLLVNFDMVLAFSQLACLLIETLLFVISLLDQVFIYNIDGLWRHFFLLLCSCLCKVIDNLFIAILELARLIDLLVKVSDDLPLNVLRHLQIARISNRRASVEHNIHEAGHAPAESSPQVLRLTVGLRQLPRAYLL